MNRQMGNEGCLYIVAHAATAMPTGYHGYAIVINTDGTIIASVTIGGSAVTNLSWEGVALQRGDYIPLATPLTSITLTADADSVFIYLEHI
jgi:hypothetical protein